MARQTRLCGSRFPSRSRSAALLVHAVKVVDRTRATPERMPCRDRCRDIGLGKQRGFGDAATKRKMAGKSSGECTASSMRRVATLPFSLNHLLLDPLLRGEAEQVNRFIQMPSRHSNNGSTHGVEVCRGGLHLVKIGYFEAGQEGSFLHVWCYDVGERQESIDKELEPGGVQQVRTRGGFENRVEDYVQPLGLAAPVEELCRRSL